MNFLISFAITLLATNAVDSLEPKMASSEQPQPEEPMPNPNPRIQPVPNQYGHNEDESIYDQITKQLFYRVAPMLKNSTNPLLDYKDNRVQAKLFGFINDLMSDIDGKIQHLYSVGLKFQDSEGFKAGYMFASVAQFKRGLGSFYAELRSRKGETDELALIAIFEQLNRAEKKLDALLTDLIRTWRHRKVELDSKKKSVASEYYLDEYADKLGV